MTVTFRISQLAGFTGGATAGASASCCSQAESSIRAMREPKRVLRMGKLPEVYE